MASGAGGDKVSYARSKIYEQHSELLSFTKQDGSEGWDGNCHSIPDLFSTGKF